MTKFRRTAMHKPRLGLAFRLLRLSMKKPRRGGGKAKTAKPAWDENLHGSGVLSFMASILKFLILIVVSVSTFWLGLSMARGTIKPWHNPAPPDYSHPYVMPIDTWGTRDAPTRADAMKPHASVSASSTAMTAKQAKALLNAKKHDHCNPVPVNCEGAACYYDVRADPNACKWLPNAP